MDMYCVVARSKIVQEYRNEISSWRYLSAVSAIFGASKLTLSSCSCGINHSIRMAIVV